MWATALSTDRFYDGYSTNEMCAALTVADFNNDGRADVVASFIHVVVYTNAASVGSADYSNSWGMYFNRGVYVFWNDGSSSLTRTVLYSTDAFDRRGRREQGHQPRSRRPGRCGLQP